MTNPKIKGKPCPQCGSGGVCHDLRGFRYCRRCYFKWRAPK